MFYTAFGAKPFGAISVLWYGFYFNRMALRKDVAEEWFFCKLSHFRLDTLMSGGDIPSSKEWSYLGHDTANITWWCYMVVVLLLGWLPSVGRLHLMTFSIPWTGLLCKPGGRSKRSWFVLASYRDVPSFPTHTSRLTLIGINVTITHAHSSLLLPEPLHIRHHFFISCTHLWNSLPDYVVCASSASPFKRQLRSAPLFS